VKAPVSEPISTNVRALAREHPDRMRLVARPSPWALDEVEAADAWIVDGDHNHWTVSRELEHALAAAEAAGRPPLVVLHDVGWPCARRDFYYAPDALPPEAVHAHSFARGVVPGEAGVVDRGGLRGEGRLAVALHEGGPRNGVLTAVEDVLARRANLHLAVVPAVYGVGVVWPAEAPFAAVVGALLEPWDRAPLLERLERNRVRLYLRVLELQDELTHADRRRLRVLTGLDARIAELEAENAELRLALARATSAVA
jgi:hypothetical protein